MRDKLRDKRVREDEIASRLVQRDQANRKVRSNRVRCVVLCREHIRSGFLLVVKARIAEDKRRKSIVVAVRDRYEWDTLQTT